MPTTQIGGLTRACMMKAAEGREKVEDEARAVSDTPLPSCGHPGFPNIEMKKVAKSL